MSELNKPGVSGSPPTRLGRLAIPPRTLPNQLDVSSPLLFDATHAPFSPTSPGKRSPGRPKTMKEYEEDVKNLKRENFNLKVRIYFMEQSRFDPNMPKDIDELRNAYTELKIEYELQKKDLNNKEDLLLNTYKALDAQKQQLEQFQVMKTEYEAEKLELQSRIECLENELKEYHLKFMETSIQLDDTNAMYAITFGLNNKPSSSNANINSEEKINKLENDLAKEKERVLMLEDMIAGVNEKSAKDQECLHDLHEQLVALEEKLTNALKERDLLEGTLKEAHQQEIMVHRKLQVMKQKESELKSLKTMVKDLEKELASVKYKLQEKQETPVTSNTVEHEKHIKTLLIENAKLKQEIKHYQHQLEKKGCPRPLRERSAGRSNSEQERRQFERESQLKIEELQKEIADLKSNKSYFNHGSVESLIQTLCKENKLLKKEIEKLKTASHKISGNHSDSSKEEVNRLK